MFFFCPRVVPLKWLSSNKLKIMRNFLFICTFIRKERVFASKYSTQADKSNDTKPKETRRRKKKHVQTFVVHITDNRRWPRQRALAMLVKKLKKCVILSLSLPFCSITDFGAQTHGCMAHERTHVVFTSMCHIKCGRKKKKEETQSNV